MKKIFNWLSNNILFIFTLFLLAFIPLYPKMPLVDIVNTWVYIRLEDFIVVVVVALWTFLLLKKKISLKTPLTVPIFLFWIAGAIATIHGVLLIFPEIANVFPNVALLSFFRRIEYLSLFFVAFTAMRDKQMMPYVVAVVVLTLFAVVAYGVGQRYAGFPAYLTMNEEFAKGEPIQLSALGRVPSTFAGHYDLAAYLVLIIPIVVSLIFGVKNWLLKFIFFAAAGSGLLLLFWTVSRVSLFVLLICLAIVVFVHKRKWVLISLPILGIIFAALFIQFSPRVVERFGSTVKEINVLVNADTGEALGNVQDITKEDLREKVVRKRTFQGMTSIDSEVKGASTDPDIILTTPEEVLAATESAIIPYEFIPATGVLLVPPNESTGENLPQGTGYINLPLSPIREQRNVFFYVNKQALVDQSPEIQMYHGRFLVKKAYAYDLSFTTRYQGEWPNAIEAFKRNILFGSGYGSISLAIDNSYLRMLGEVGLFGFITFFIIFLAGAAYIRQVLPQVTSPLARTFVIGFVVGVFGLLLNATLIDVFEASKVAFTLWLLAGVTIGLLHLYQQKSFVLYRVLRNVATSSYAVMVYLVIITFFIYSPMLGNYFIGDDFTWFRWAAEGGNSLQTIFGYFTQADGFFYRPGSKLYFLFMYSIFWLNPVAYHAVSLSIHMIVVILVFLLAQKLLKHFALSVLAAFLFVFLSGYHEAIFWISSVGHLFSVMFVLTSFLFFILWYERKRIIYFVISLVATVLSLFFHELGVIAPLFMILYLITHEGVQSLKQRMNKMIILFSFVPILFYLIVRFIAQSHWAGGDYTYNLFKLPFNVVGNAIGYFLLSATGPLSLSVYETFRMLLREQLVLSGILVVVAFVCLFFGYRMIVKMQKDEKRIILFSFGFMFISLLPFLGFGNITSRYNYLVAFGFVLLIAFLAKKMYKLLVINGRDVALSVMTLVVGMFFLLHIIQVQQLQKDWRESGLKVNRFILSIQGLYQNYWSSVPLTLHVVDVPIRNGDTWVFPVGLGDALWFSFKNPDLTVHQWSSVDDAWKKVTDSRFEKVLLFDNSGTVTEQKKRSNY
ncbi:MAG TPA: hypothetical protein VLF20_04375 [Patescibacteria group bacterium]|nr:hypothetical protein [Patescibacteria group bacterium]